MAKFLAERIGAMDAFELWNDTSDIPAFAWRHAAGYTKNWSPYDLSDRLRQEGRLVPAHPMPDNLADMTVQQIVVRNGLSMDLAGALLKDIEESVHYLDRFAQPLPAKARSGFHH
ncbi:hypothetical protein AB0D09_36240 [Streptomyces sp. NPDC049097]|uniref:hypothetical protein n=1 Tax=unclassified Streptomyces TaxID=2593676 RepID=UPI0033FACD14